MAVGLAQAARRSPRLLAAAAVRRPLGNGRRLARRMACAVEARLMV
ncbi:MAG: hypothetical protein WKH64_04930 [Chloroflexia bacterium]